MSFSQSLGRNSLVSGAGGLKQRQRVGRRALKTVARLPFDPPLFNPAKLSVTFLQAGETSPPSSSSASSNPRALGPSSNITATPSTSSSNGASPAPSPQPYARAFSGASTSTSLPLPQRHYTLTHNDLTGALCLSIGPEYNNQQISGWYTRLLRDEVLAEWVRSPSGCPELQVHVHISGEHGWWLAPPALRNYIFRREMSLVLDSIRYADREFLRSHPRLAGARVVVHFHSDQAEFDRVDVWGQLDLPATWPADLSPSFQPEPLILRGPRSSDAETPADRDPQPDGGRSGNGSGTGPVSGDPSAPSEVAPPSSAQSFQGVEVTSFNSTVLGGAADFLANGKGRFSPLGTSNVGGRRKLFSPVVGSQRPSPGVGMQARD